MCGCGEPAPRVTQTNRAQGVVKGQPRRFIRGHGHRKTGWVKSGSGCWEWTGSMSTTGYGRIHRAGGWTGAHRWVYEQHVGPIPEGLEIDHLCRNKRCVNPDHLEPVTGLENIRRSALLSVEKAAEIRASEETTAELARRYGVARSTIHKVRIGASWR